MTFVVAIAFNFSLTALNIYLLLKIRRWHHALWRIHSILRQTEQQLQATMLALPPRMEAIADSTQVMIYNKKRLDFYLKQLRQLFFLLRTLQSIMALLSHTTRNQRAQLD